MLKSSIISLAKFIAIIVALFAIDLTYVNAEVRFLIDGKLYYPGDETVVSTFSREDDLEELTNQFTKTIRDIVSISTVSKYVNAFSESNKGDGVLYYASKSTGNAKSAFKFIADMLSTDI